MHNFLFVCGCMRVRACLCVCSYACEIQRQTEAGRNKSAEFLESPVLRQWNLTKGEGVNRCTLFVCLTGVPESSLHFSNKQACAPLQISSMPHAFLLPLPSLGHKPAHSTCRWDLTCNSSNVLGILLKNFSVCSVLSSGKPISFPTSQTACSHLTLGWFVADGK